MDENGIGSAEGGNELPEDVAGADQSNHSGNSGGLETVSPSDAKPARKRGRPAGSGTKKSGAAASPSAGERQGKAASTPLNLGFVEKALFAIHMGLSKVLDNPDLMIGEKDTKELATAIADVNKHYDVPVLSEKSQAWAKLAMVAGGIYGPMIVMSMGSRKSKQAQKSAPQSVQAAPLPSTTVDTFTNPTFVSVPQE